MAEWDPFWNEKQLYVDSNLTVSVKTVISHRLSSAVSDRVGHTVICENEKCGWNGFIALWWTFEDHILQQNDLIV